MQEILVRLQGLTGIDPADISYRQMLIDEAHAEEAPGHLLGPVPVAVELLRTLEAKELEAGFRLGQS